MSVLVTGGAGYIGSHTCVSLLNRGMDVIILDDFSNSNQKVVQRIEHMTKKEVKYYSIDLKDKDAVHSVFADNEIEAVIHFAGYKAVGESVVNPLSYYDNNLISTIYLLQVMKQFNVKNWCLALQRLFMVDQSRYRLRRMLIYRPLIHMAEQN